MNLGSLALGSKQVRAKLEEDLLEALLGRLPALAAELAPDAALQAAAHECFRELIELRSHKPELLASLYQQVLGYGLVETGGGKQALIRCPQARKALGSYYTPASLAGRLARIAIEPLLEEHSPLAVRVCDPACGAGDLLLAAGDLLAGAEVRIGLSLRKARQSVAMNCLFGVDTDATALMICDARLREWASLDRMAPMHLLHADSMSLCWETAFPQRERFHAVIANPPFGNVIEGRVPLELRKTRAERFPELGGTADLAYYFCSLASDLLCNGGRASLVQPRAFLSSPSAKGLRAGCHGSELVFAEPVQTHDQFNGASVYVCLVGYERRESRSRLPQAAETNQLSGAFEVRASMTVAEAYDARKYLVDERQESGMRLLTTGLIEPRASLWGKTVCRYLGARYHYPRLKANAADHSGLARRLLLAKRPKLIVAGLSKRLEALLDTKGCYVGAVSTYTVTHASDDVKELEKLLEWILSPGSTKTFHAELGNTALGGGNTTVTKRFLKSLVGAMPNQ